MITRRDERGVPVFKTVITEEELQEALSKRKSNPKALVEVIKGMGLLTDADLDSISDLKLYAIPTIHLTTELFSKDALRLVSKVFCLEHTLIPVRFSDNMLTVAISDPMNVIALQKLKEQVNSPLRVVHADESEIQRCVHQLYLETSETKSEEDILVTVKEISDAAYEEEPEAAETTKPDSGPVVRLVDTTIRQAIERGASDIHWEPHEKEAVVRFRIDGHLVDYMKFPKNIFASVVCRIKIIAGIDIAETRRPQDGRCYVATGGRRADLRIATVRCLYGEKVVIRILNKGTDVLTLEQSGISQYNYELLTDIISHSQGMVLLTGPTGSGKTTTLYAILRQLMSLEKNIVTIEDPVEYQLPRVNQIPVVQKAGVSFATILRSVLRLDPDIIMVGEIRDFETAEIAIQAALTGHLVLATLHTNDAPGAITRLVDLGVKPYLAAAAVTGVVAQRLLRRICAECRESYATTTEEHIIAARKQIELSPTLFRGKGCSYCNGTGYKGRSGVHEILKMNHRIQHQILTGTGLGDLPETCFEEGMVTLLDDAMTNVFNGITTFQEFLNVVG